MNVWAIADLHLSFAREDLREAAQASLPSSPFTIDASAWTAIGTV